jgi:hypothetical protein
MPCGAGYQVGRSDELYAWLDENVDGPTGEAILLWLMTYCASPRDNPAGRTVGGEDSLRRVAIVPGTRVVLEMLLVDQFHVVQFLDAWFV